MTDADRIAALEAQLAATKKAAVHVMVGMAQGIAQTPDGLRYLAAGFAEAAKDTDPIIAGLVQKVAEALREAANGATVLDVDTGNGE